MRQYILRRLLQMIPILLGVSIILFVIVKSTPGDPYAYLFGPNVDPTLKARLMEENGFNDPLPVQYVRWLGTTLSGNLGYTIRRGEPVIDKMKQAVPPTLILTGAALLIALVFAIPLGVIAATRHNSWIDYLITVFSVGGISLPSFFAAMLAVYVFAVHLKWFPMNQMYTVGGEKSFTDLLWHLTLPALTLGLRDMAAYARFTRSAMLEVLRQDYVRTAASKGLPKRMVVYKHALRNSLIPVVTLFGFSLPGLFGGAIIFEQVFTWPGMGLLSLEAVSGREYSVLMAVNLMFAFLVIMGNLVADVLYAIVDPRIRYT